MPSKRAKSKKSKKAKSAKNNKPTPAPTLRPTPKPSKRAKVKKAKTTKTSKKDAERKRESGAFDEPHLTTQIDQQTARYQAMRSRPTHDEGDQLKMHEVPQDFSQYNSIENPRGRSIEHNSDTLASPQTSEGVNTHPKTDNIANMAYQPVRQRGHTDEEQNLFVKAGDKPENIVSIRDNVSSIRGRIRKHTSDATALPSTNSENDETVDVYQPLRRRSQRKYAPIVDDNIDSDVGGPRDATDSISSSGFDADSEKAARYHTLRSRKNLKEKDSIHVTPSSLPSDFIYSPTIVDQESKEYKRGRSRSQKISESAKINM